MFYNSNMSLLSLGKLPPEQLVRLLGNFKTGDPAVVLGPGIGRDCAVLDLGDQLLIAKSDPITFATDEIGWYAVHVNANDVATTGAAPRWFLSTVLLPQAIDAAAIDSIFDQIRSACTGLGATVVGGHTEVTHGIDRPIVIGTLLGLVPRDQLILPTGAQPGDALILTKQLAVEATSLIAREKSSDLLASFDSTYLQHCRRFLHEPGISVVPDARAAIEAGRVHAMHDPTEGGLATALTELAIASQVDLEVDSAAVRIYPETHALCDYFGLDPWGVIASGSLLLAVEREDTNRVVVALLSAGIDAVMIGHVMKKSAQPSVMLLRDGRLRSLPGFARDEIAKLF